MLIMNQNSICNKIVTEAKTWIGTKFHHQGRLKKTEFHSCGCDCIGLIVGIAKELKLYSKCYRYFHEFDIKNYSLFSDHEYLITILDSLLYRSTYAIGNILILKISQKSYHVAIISGNEKIIHCSMELGAVTEQTITKCWQKRISSIYSFEE